MPRIRMSFILAAAAVAGCSANGAGDVLVGTWGAENVRISGSGREATLLMPCGAATFTGPIVLDADGRFGAVGVLTYSMVQQTEIVYVHLSGFVTGRNVGVAFYAGDPVSPPPTVIHLLTPNGYYPTIACVAVAGR